MNQSSFNITFPPEWNATVITEHLNVSDYWDPNWLANNNTPAALNYFINKGIFLEAYSFYPLFFGVKGIMNQQNITANTTQDMIPQEEPAA